MREVTILIVATHEEASDTPLAGALARFAAKNLNTMGYTVQDISCMDQEWVSPVEPEKPEWMQLPEEVDDVPEAKEEEEAAQQIAPEPDEAVADITVHEGSKDGPKKKAAAKTKALIDPSEFSIRDLRSGLLDGYIKRQLNSLLQREMKGGARVGAIAAINSAIDKL